MSKSLVSAATVRTWARENTDAIRSLVAEQAPDATAEQVESAFEAVTKCLGESARGRLNPVVVLAFTRAHKSKGYAEKASEAVMVEQPYTALNSRGARITKTWKGTGSEARVLNGQGDKGRLNRTSLRTALEADLPVKAESVSV